MFNFTIQPYPFGTRFSFPERGDGIGMHKHVPETYHSTLVEKGSVQIYGPDKAWCRILLAGEEIDLDGDLSHHEIVALEPDTVVLNIFLGGMPEFIDLTTEEMSGTVTDKPVTLPLDTNP